ncbi:MAG TPA: RluA family pseudouridine synthase [Candidatus Pullilachnospira intestinigallinarum]|nr:RluA family pseudouridine synthase [Candidatus Pullilachnospira intestinigallinarum]
MEVLEIGKNEAGQRLDKYLKKYMNQAPGSFLYRMLRKKNILLNGKRAAGSEKLSVGDQVTLYLSGETIAKFRDGQRERKLPSGRAPYAVIYEDENIMLLDKPAGLLSQKASPEDVSLVEYLTADLLRRGEISDGQLSSFHPSVCNRLDRNTSGLVLAGKTLKGLQDLSQALKERTVDKYYLALVRGNITGAAEQTAYLRKEAGSNQVAVLPAPAPSASLIRTAWEPLWSDGGCTLLRVKLITGKTHQIRSHLAGIGHPLAGDPKYGDPVWNRQLKEACGLNRQFLHAWQVTFARAEGCLAPLNGRTMTAPLPKDLAAVLKKKHGPGNPGDLVG